MSFKLSQFNERTQAKLRALLADDLRPIPSTIPQPVGRRIASPADSPQTGRTRRLVVSLLGLRRRTLDDDNFVGACKHLRDAIAASIGIDDGDKRIKFQYQQLQTKGLEGVLVHIEII